MKKRNEKTPLLLNDVKQDKLELSKELLKILRSKPKSNTHLGIDEALEEMSKINELKNFFNNIKMQSIELDLNNITVTSDRVKKSFLQYVIDKKIPNTIIEVFLKNGLKISDKIYAYDLADIAIKVEDSSFMKLIITSSSQNLFKREESNTMGDTNDSEDS